MGMSIVLDTNAVLYFLAGRLAEPLPQADFYVSVITEIESLLPVGMQPFGNLD